MTRIIRPTPPTPQRAFQTRHRERDGFSQDRPLRYAAGMPDLPYLHLTLAAKTPLPRYAWWLFVLFIVIVVALAVRDFARNPRVKAFARRLGPAGPLAIISGTLPPL